MRQLTKNVYVETEKRGSNHGIVTTTDGIVLIDGPHKPSDTLRLKADIERRGPLRYILNTEPHGDHWTSNAYFDVPSSPTRAYGSASSPPTWTSTWRGWPRSAPMSPSSWRATGPTRPSSRSRTRCACTWATRPSA